MALCFLKRVRNSLGKKLKRVIKRDRGEGRMFEVRRMPVGLERVQNAQP